MDIITRKIKNSTAIQFFQSIRFKIVGIYFLIMICTLAVIDIYTIGVLNNNLYEAYKGDLFAKANVIADTISAKWMETKTWDYNILSDTIDKTVSGTDIRCIVTETSYKVIYDTRKESQLLGKVFIRDSVTKALSDIQDFNIEKVASNNKMLSVSVPVKMGDKIIGTVYLTKSIFDADKIVNTTKVHLIVFSALICFLIGMLIFALSYIISSPMEEFTKIAKEISKGNFKNKVNVKGHDEISQMGESLNYMCAELEHLEQKRRKFVSDASHELKTPMATIKLICDSIVDTSNPDIGMVREFLHDLSEEIDRLTRIVERLLTLTKLDSGEQELILELVDVGMLIKRIDNKLMTIAAAKNITLTTEILTENLQPAYLDYDKIWEAFYNIIDNAIKYSKIGGRVHVAVLTEGDKIIIKITDTGIGIPDEFKERIFERFYRVDVSRARETGGTGLGLAIAKEAIGMHGGTIDIKDNPEGGSIFIVTLPYKTHN